jgi:hypothetical protein
LLQSLVNDGPTPHGILLRDKLDSLIDDVLIRSLLSSQVTVDEKQIAWFEDLLENHPAEDGWKIFCFTHAPPIGSGLRVLQENHVINGCCWLNHSGGSAKFIELVRSSSNASPLLLTLTSA